MQEDVAQDVFCKLWLQPELWLDNDKELDNYIFIMTRNIVLNIFKHQQVEQEYQSEVVRLPLQPVAHVIGEVGDGGVVLLLVILEDVAGLIAGCAVNAWSILEPENAACARPLDQGLLASRSNSVLNCSRQPLLSRSRSSLATYLLAP